MAHAVRTSVVIATYNRWRWLDQTLAALARCVHGGVEVVVVDNGSRDRTAEAALAHASRMDLRLISEDRAGKRFAIHTGVHAARGELVIFADDDVIPAATDWVAAYEEAARAHPEAAFFGGPVRPWFPVNASLPAWYPRLAPASRAGLARPEGPVGEPILAGANWAARRGPLLAAVDATLRGRRPKRARWTSQETSLQRALLERGHRGWFVPSATVLHRVPRHELKLAWLRKWRYKVGRGEAEAFILECGGAPRWRFRKMADNLLGIARDGGPHHRKAVVLQLARDLGFLAELVRLGREGRRAA